MKAKPGGKQHESRKRPVVFKRPPQPRGLTEEQKRHWKELAANPLLQAGDVSLLHDYMAVLKLRDKAEKELQDGLLLKTDRGGKKTHPAFRIHRDCSAQLLKLRDMMLLSPKARAKANVQSSPSPSSPEDDPFAELIDE